MASPIARTGFRKMPLLRLSAAAGSQLNSNNGMIAAEFTAVGGLPDGFLADVAVLLGDHRTILSKYHCRHYSRH